MSLTYEQAYDEMLDMFKAGWDTTGYDVFYEDGPEDDHTGTTPYVVQKIQHLDSDQRGFGASSGQRMFQRDGLLTFQVCSLSAKGLSGSYQLAKVVADIYEGKSSPGGVWFRSVRIREAGTKGAFYQTNVIISFEYYEAK